MSRRSVQNYCITLTCTKTKALVVHFLTPAPEDYKNEDFGVSPDSVDVKERRFASSRSGICSWGISSNGRAPASHAGSTGIDTRILQDQDFLQQ